MPTGGEMNQDADQRFASGRATFEKEIKKEKERRKTHLVSLVELEHSYDIYYIISPVSPKVQVLK